MIQAGISLQNLWIALLTIECPKSPIDRNRAPFEWSLFLSPSFVLFALALFLYFGSYSSILLIVPYLHGHGISQMRSAWAVTAQTVAEIIFRPIFAFSLNSFQNRKLDLMAFSALAMALSLVAVIFAENYVAIMGIMVLQGACLAFCGGLPTSIICDLAGYHRLPTAFMFFSLTVDGSFMLGPILYSKLGFKLFFPNIIFITAASIGILSMTMVLLTKCFVEKK